MTISPDPADSSPDPSLGTTPPPELERLAALLAEHQTGPTVMGGWSLRNGKDSDRCWGWVCSCGASSPDQFKIDLTKHEADDGRFRHVAEQVTPLTSEVDQ